MNLGKERKSPNKKFSVACRLQQAVLNLLEGDFVYRSALVITEQNKSKIYICLSIVLMKQKPGEFRQSSVKYVFPVLFTTKYNE